MQSGVLPIYLMTSGTNENSSSRLMVGNFESFVVLILSLDSLMRSDWSPLMEKTKDLGVKIFQVAIVMKDSRCMLAALIVADLTVDSLQCFIR